jgi:anti-anti-sigma factor
MAARADTSTFIFRFGEKISIDNTDRYIEEVSRGFDAPGISRVVFDLENVRECSSYGLRLFLIFQRRAEKDGKTLLLFRPNPVMFDLLKTIHLDHVFTIVSTLEN